MSELSPVAKIGLIGVGLRLHLVVESLVKASRGKIQVRALCDPDPVAVERALKAFPGEVAVCGTARELAERPDIDWVFVGSLNCQHRSHVCAALDSGKNVFCEKPLATSLEDCLAVRDAVHRSKRMFSFGLVLRYSPHYQRVHEIIRSGAIGEIVSLEFNETLHFNHGGYIFGNWRRNRALAGTHLLEKCCHDLDIANWLTGSRPAKAASFGGIDFFVPGNEKHMVRAGRSKNGLTAYQTFRDSDRRVNPFSPGADIFDNQVVILEYENGVRAAFHTNCNTAIPERRFYICGTEGTLRADMINARIELQRIGFDVEKEIIETKVNDGHGGGDEIMAAGLCRTMLEGAPPLATVDDGVRACAAAFGIDQAADEGRVVNLASIWRKVDDA